MSDVLQLEELPDLFASVSCMFLEKKEELCEMDARMGDGDLGLTMSKGYGVLPDLIREDLGEGDIGKCLMKAGMKMGAVVPSTMGTLMASGLMTGGKGLKGKKELTGPDMVAYLRGFAEGIKKRGKAEIGDRTILDAIDRAADFAENYIKENPASSLTQVMEEAVRGAKVGMEATRDMVPVYGKAAVFADRARGIPDQGAVAGYYMVLGMKNYFDASFPCP